MTKPFSRAYSHYATDACRLLGSLIREARIEQRMTVVELAERTGVSCGLVTHAEAGDMGCSIGVVFEMAAILKISLFDLEPDAHNVVKFEYMAMRLASESGLNTANLDWVNTSGKSVLLVERFDSVSCLDA